MRTSLLVFFLLFPMLLHAAPPCQPQADSPLELVFCQLKAGRYGRSLPTLDEFRRNPATMQYLLLKRPAKRAGIELRPPTAGQQPAVARKPNAPLPASAPAPAHRSACEYHQEWLKCGARRYTLVTNRSNQHLEPGALSGGNRLILVEPGPQVNEQNWLADAYTRYIDAMLSIGLGASTSTYSAFAHTYYELQAQGADFSSRIQQSFEQLKIDKRTLAVARKRPNRAPRPQECEPLNERLIVCNAEGKNWVYALSD